MHTSSEATPTATLTASYARPKRSVLRRARRWWLLVGVIVVMGGLALGLRSPVRGWLERLLGGEEGTGALHVVEPGMLNITLTEDGELEPRESVKIKCEVEGQSTILFVVEESTRVKKGDLLVELASETLVDRLESEQMDLRRIQADLETGTEELEIQRNQNASGIKKAEIDLAVAELALRRYLEGDFQKQLKAVELDIEQTKMDIARKEDDLKKNRKLAAKGFVTPMKIEELEFDLRRAQMTKERHELSKRILLEYEKPMMEMQKTSTVDRAREELAREKQRALARENKSEARVTQYRDQLAQRQRRVERVQEQLGYCKLYAPAGGMVQYPTSGGWRWGSERIAAGEKVHEGQTLVELPDTSQMIVRTRIHEADRHLAKEGLSCVVTVTAVPGEKFSGKITKIDKFADSENRWLNPDLKEHGAEILLDPTDAPLSPGDTAEVKILIDTIEDALAVPVQCVFTRGSRSFVFVRDGGEPEPVEVTLGRSNTHMIEVVDGLKQGQQVLMKAEERLLAQLPTVDTADADAERVAAKPAPAGKPEPAAGLKRDAAFRQVADVAVEKPAATASEEPAATPTTEPAEVPEKRAAESPAPKAATSQPAAAAGGGSADDTSGS